MRCLIWLLAFFPGSGCMPEPAASPQAPGPGITAPESVGPGIMAPGVEIDCAAIAAEIDRLRQSIRGSDNAGDQPDRQPFPDVASHRRYSELGILYAEHCTG